MLLNYNANPLAMYFFIYTYKYKYTWAHLHNQSYFLSVWQYIRKGFALFT